MQECNSPEIDFRRDRKEYYVVLREDKKYCKNSVKNYVEKKFNEIIANNVMNYIEELVKDLSKYVEDYFKPLIRIEKFDVPLPRIDDNNIYLGEFPGFYPVSLMFDGYKLVLEVRPKIGWNGFDRMIRDIQNNMKIVLPTHPAGHISSILSTLRMFFINDVLNYSYLTLRLTQAVLIYPPRTRTEYIVLSEGEIGKMLVPHTIKFKVRNLPYVVCRRVSTEIFPPPLIIASRLNKLIVNDLDKLNTKLLEINVRSLSKIVNDIKNLHLTLLNHPLLKGASLYDSRSRVSDSLLIERSSRYIRLNPYVEALIKLYSSYLSKKTLLMKLNMKGLSSIFASCKVYELWVLSHILVFFKEQLKTEINLKEMKRYSLVFTIRNPDINVEVEYNKSLKEGIIFNLTKKIVRPDIVIKVGDSTVVIDAKYKYKLQPQDIHRLISYIINFGKPVKIRTGRILYGAISYLGDRDKHEEERVFDDFKFKIKLCRVNPNDSDVSKGIKRLLEELLEYLSK